MLPWPVMIPRSAPGRAWIAAGALVLVFFLQVLLVSRWKSPSWDETGHLAAGIAYLQDGNFLVNPQHPPLLKELSGLSLMLSGARLPEGPPTRELLKGNPDYQWMVGSKILVTGDFERNLLRARLPLMLVATMLAALIFIWGRQLIGTAGALGGLFLFALNPTVIAHAGFVTMDVGCSAFIVLLLFAVWNYVQRPNAGASGAVRAGDGGGAGGEVHGDFHAAGSGAAAAGRGALGTEGGGGNRRRQAGDRARRAVPLRERTRSTRIATGRRAREKRRRRRPSTTRLTGARRARFC